MIHAEAFGEQPMFRLDHVAIAVVRKSRVQAVARLARLAVADAVGQDDEEAADVEQLIRAEERRRRIRRR